VHVAVLNELIAASVTRLTPPFRHRGDMQPMTAILGALQQDSFYRYLLPLTLPVVLLTVYINWVGLKMFRHN